MKNLTSKLKNIWQWAMGVLTLGFAFALLIPPGIAAAEHSYLSSFGPDGSSTSHFEHPGAVGIDQANGTVYVADLEAGAVYKFDESGKESEFSGASNELTGFSFHPTEAGVSQIAVDSSSHIFYVVEDAPTNSVAAFAPNGDPSEFSALSSNALTGFGEVCGVAVDSNGDIYVGDFSSGVRIYSATGEEIDSFTTPEACNLAVDSNGSVYVNHWHGSVEEFKASSYPVTPGTNYSAKGTIDSNPAYGVAVDPLTNDVYVDEGTKIAKYAESGTALETFAGSGPGAVSTSEGIAVLATAELAYVSDGGGERQVSRFGPPPPPASPEVESEYALSAGYSEATVGARIDPERAETSYFFEYGPTSSLGMSTEAHHIPATNSGVDIQAELTGLKPGAVYHFRVVATNSIGTETGDDAQFATFARTTRGEEKCKNSAIQAEQGSEYLPDCRAYEKITPSSKDAGYERAPVPGRGAAISAPDGVSVVFEATAPLPGANSGPLIGNLYLATRDEAGWRLEGMAPPQESIAGTGGKVPLFFAIAPDLSKSIVVNENPLLTPDAVPDVPSMYLETGAAKKYELMTPAGMSSFLDETFGGGSADFARIFYGTKIAQTAGAPPGEPQVYEWTAAGVRLAGILPDESIAPAAFPAVESTPNIPLWDVERATSVDGSRFFFVTRGFFSGHPFQELYLRENSSTTTDVSASQRTVSDPNGPERNIFWTASSNGSRVFFTSPSELTDNANTGVEELPGPVFKPTDLGNDLYEYDVGAEKLTDLSVDESPGDSSTGADVLGVVGASTDGSYVYFVAKGTLAPGAVAGKANLYMSHDGVITFIASLDPTADDQDWTKEVVGFSARISPDGKTLAFTSVEPLTGYVNVDAHTGERDSEVFVYRADAAKLVCASCNPSGSRPIGPSSIVSKGVPLWATSLNRTLTRNVSDNGSRIFFNSQDALAPRDTNNKQDVYVYEGERPYLLSSGIADQEAYFGDASASGNDVFIGTRARLLESDGDEFGDLYDVRVGGGRPEDHRASECLGDSCRSNLGGVLSEPTIGSSDFEGAGNPNARLKCARLERRSRHLSQRAQLDLRRARHQPDTSRRLKLHRQAAMLKKRATRLANRAKRCLGSGGGKR